MQIKSLPLPCTTTNQPTIQNHQAAARAQEQLEGRRVTLGQAVEQGVAAVSACGWMGGVGGWGGVGWLR